MGISQSSEELFSRLDVNSSKELELDQILSISTALDTPRRERMQLVAHPLLLYHFDRTREGSLRVHELDALLATLNRYRDGDIEEFRAWATKTKLAVLKKCRASAKARQHFCEWLFRLLDIDRTGRVSATNLEHLVRMLGNETANELMYANEDVDAGGDADDDARATATRAAKGAKKRTKKKTARKKATASSTSSTSSSSSTPTPKKRTSTADDVRDSARRLMTAYDTSSSHDLTKAEFLVLADHLLRAAILREDAGVGQGEALAGYRLGALLGTGAYGCVRVGVPTAATGATTATASTTSTSRSASADSAAAAAAAATIGKTPPPSDEPEYVAIKVLERRGDAAEMAAHVAAEVACMRRASLRVAPAVHGVIEDDARMAIVMQLVNGCALSTLLVDANGARLCVAEPTARFVARQLTRALATLHAAGVAHRDVKLENVLCDAATRRICLVDFGHATDIGDGTDEWRSDLVGSVHCIAPEQLREAPYAATKLDGWALGVVTYRLVAGAFPFVDDETAMNASAFMQNVREGSYDVHEQWSAPLTDFIERLLCVDVTQRAAPRDAAEHAWLREATADDDDDDDGGGGGGVSDAERAVERLFVRRAPLLLRASSNKTTPAATTTTTAEAAAIEATARVVEDALQRVTPDVQFVRANAAATSALTAADGIDAQHQQRLLLYTCRRLATLDAPGYQMSLSVVRRRDDGALNVACHRLIGCAVIYMRDATTLLNALAARNGERHSKKGK